MGTKIVFRNVCGMLAAMAFTACSGNGIEGAWVEPVPGMAGMTQGIKMEVGGKASSINMATLRYETWKREGDRLILTGKSVGNRQTLPFVDTLVIEKLTQDSLILKKGTFVVRYSKQDGGGTEDGAERTAAVVVPDRKAFTVKGELIIGHEVRSFVQEGEAAAYWIVDETRELMQKYDEITGGTKNGMPVHAELEVVDAGKAKDGFAADYAGVYRILKINRLSLK